MRFVVTVLTATLCLAGCQKPKPKVEEPKVEATPTPTPEPTPEPTPTPVAIDTNAQVIVLCYHRFEDRPKDTLAIKPSEFEAQMQVLKDKGISVISMSDFLAWRRGEKNIPAKSAIISIDDGYISGYSVAWPILKKFGYPFTMFIYTDYVKGGKNAGGLSMTWDQLAEMRDAGVDIESHTVSHSALNAKKGKTDEQYREWLMGELAGSKQLLEQKLGIEVKALAFPYGLHNEVVRETAKAAGYEAAFTVYGQRLAHDAGAMLLGRYAIESMHPKIFEQAASFTGAVEGSASGVAGGGLAEVMPASATMLTQPMDGSTISDPTPEIKINLAALGAIDPKSVVMRISGMGPVPAKYDEKSKLLSYKVAQKLRAGSPVTVIVSATAAGKRVETRWSFNFDPTAPAAPAESAPAAPAPANP